MTVRRSIYLISFVIALNLIFGSSMHFAEAYDRSIVTSEPRSESGLVAGTPHGPIVIDGDANFSDTAIAEGWPGDGSADTPYIIDGLDIDLGDSPGPCINISNTQVNFTISNCWLTSSSLDPGTGIYLNNVNNGELINNTCIDSYYGIFLYYSDFNSVARNTCRNNTYSGIRIGYGDFNNVTHNNISLAGVSGIVIFGSSSSNRIGHNTLIDNRDGIAVFTYNPNQIHDNNCSNGRDGIVLSGGNYIVSNNTCMGNTRDGIDMNSAYDSILKNNTCSGNGYYGMEMYDAYNITITNNTITNNDYNIMLSNSEVTIIWNVLADSLTANLYDDYGHSNFEYNYYSDYAGIDGNQDGIGDTPYNFDYDSDPYPLMFPPYAPVWQDSPTDQTFEVGSIFRYDLNATAPSPLTWWVNDTLNFVIVEDGVLYSLNPGIGTYGLEVLVSNIYGLSIPAEFAIHVMDYPPSWVIAPEDQILNYGEPFDYLISVVDSVGISMWTLNDTISFDLIGTESQGVSTAIISNSSLLAPGVYGLNITVYDIGGNSLSDVFTVTVLPLELDTTSPVWIVSPFSIVIHRNEPFMQHLGAWDESDIHHWWVNDTTHFTVDENGVIRNATFLHLGAYGLEVRAYDPYDNYCSATILITIIEDYPTAITSTTATTTTTQEGMDPLLSFGVGAGIGGAAILVVVLLFLRKKS